MVEIDSKTDRIRDVTYVRATVTNTHSAPQVVRVESQLDGPIWSPRVNSHTEPAWDGDTWVGRIEPGRTRGFGFASPGSPQSPPVEIRSTTRADDSHYGVTDVLASLDPPTTTMSRYCDRR